MKSKLKTQKSTALCIVFSLVMMFGVILTASAKDLCPKPQVPNYYRMNLGQFQITALLDGNMTMDGNLFFGISEAEKEELLSRMFISGEIPSGVNAYLINTGSKLVLVDTGAGAAFGDTLGKVPRMLRKAGYRPWQINAVLITHGHPDHIGGLLNSNDEAVYPRAKVYISEPEAAFWLSAENMEQAPEVLKSNFLMVQKAASVLSAKGKWQTFNDGETPIPGIQAILTPGHTPGMTAFKVSSDDQTLLIWGDIINLAVFQMPKPMTAFAYDMSPGDAIAARLSQLEGVALDKTLVAGSHLPFPGFGHVRKEDAQSYAWVPVYFSAQP